MKAWTDYPFESLGDEAYSEAPIREVDVLSYDRNKYCKVSVDGVIEEVKSGYLYRSQGRLGEVKNLPLDALLQLPEEFDE